MSTPQHGELAYTVQQAFVASLDPVSNVYGTPAIIGYVKDGEISSEVDSDTILAQGATREILTVHTGDSIKLSEAWCSDAATDILTGEVTTESGGAGNLVSERIRAGAGGGLPYIGLVLLVSATAGSFFVFGAPKCKLTSKPAFKFEQNKFRTGEIELAVATATATVNKISRTVRYQHVSDLPDFSDQAAFQSFFQGMFT